MKMSFYQYLMMRKLLSGEICHYEEHPKHDVAMWFIRRPEEPESLLKYDKIYWPYFRKRTIEILEENGWVIFYEDTDYGGKIKVYKITDSGRLAYESDAAEFARCSQQALGIAKP